MNAYNGARRRSGVVVAVAVFALIPVLTASTLSGFRQSSSGVSGEPTRTTVRDVSAAVSGASIVVTGTATFVEFPTYVGEDPARDTKTPLPGTDLTSAAIEREPGSASLTFTLGMTDMPPTGGALGYVYNWPLVVDSESSDLMLQASVGLVDCLTGDVDVEPLFRLVRGGFDEVTTLRGSFADSRVTFNDVPMELIGAAGGSRITTGGEPTVSTAGIAGCGYFPNSMGDSIAVGTYVVPEMTLRVAVRSADSPALRPLGSRTVVVAENGEPFRLMMPTPQDPGRYEVSVEACYGASRCAVQAVIVSVAVPGH